MPNSITGNDPLGYHDPRLVSGQRFLNRSGPVRGSLSAVSAPISIIFSSCFVNVNFSFQRLSSLTALSLYITSGAFRRGRFYTLVEPLSCRYQKWFCQGDNNCQTFFRRYKIIVESSQLFVILLRTVAQLLTQSSNAISSSFRRWSRGFKISSNVECSA